MAALAALASGASERAAILSIASMGEAVSRQPVHDFVRDDLPRLASRTLLLLSPHETEVHVELLLFHRNTPGALFLLHELGKREFVARVEDCSGSFNVVAEVVAPSRAEANAIAEEFAADERLLLLKRSDRMSEALFETARAIHRQRR